MFVEKKVYGVCSWLRRRWRLIMRAHVSLTSCSICCCNGAPWLEVSSLRGKKYDIGSILYWQAVHVFKKKSNLNPRIYHFFIYKYFYVYNVAIFLCIPISDNFKPLYNNPLGNCAGPFLKAIPAFCRLRFVMWFEMSWMCIYAYIFIPLCA